MRNEKDIVSSILDIYNKCDSETSKLKSICSEGCHYCCKQPIHIFAIEEYAIRYHIDKSAKAVKNMIRKKMRKWFEQFNKLLFPYQSLHKNQLYEIMTNKKHDFPECPFLIEGKCSIYQVRPFVCRVHIVINDKDACIKDPRRDPTPDSIAIRSSLIDDFIKLQGSSQMRLITYATREMFELMNIKVIPIGVDYKTYYKKQEVL